MARSSPDPPTQGPFSIALYIGETRASSWTPLDTDNDRPVWRLFRNAPANSVFFVVWDLLTNAMYRINVTQPSPVRAGDDLMLSDIEWDWQPTAGDPLHAYAHRTDKAETRDLR